MLTEDYLIRRINQVIALLMHALGLRKDGQLVAAQTDVDIALELLLGMRASLLKQMDDASLLNLLTVRGELDLERLELAAELFEQEGQILAAQGRPAESYADMLRALNFSLELGLSDRVHLDAERAGRIEDLVKTLESRRLPIDTQVGLVNYYQALLEKGGAGLRASGLERAQVEAALAKWMGQIQAYESNPD
jgi:hypothetical protein